MNTSQVESNLFCVFSTFLDLIQNVPMCLLTFTHLTLWDSILKKNIPVQPHRLQTAFAFAEVTGSETVKTSIISNLVVFSEKKRTPTSSLRIASFFSASAIWTSLLRAFSMLAVSSSCVTVNQSSFLPSSQDSDNQLQVLWLELCAQLQ